MNNKEFREKVGKLFQSREFMLAVASDGKPEPVTDLNKAALSVCSIYAVVALFLEGKDNSDIEFKGLEDRLLFLSLCVLAEDAENLPIRKLMLEVGNRCARLAWQTQQPLIAIEKIDRPIMGFTSGNLSPEEIEKDTVRIVAKAKFLVEWLKKDLTAGVLAELSSLGMKI
jgi:hypothetical protein